MRKRRHNNIFRGPQARFSTIWDTPTRHTGALPAPARAAVITDLCTGCGRCASVCPTGAAALGSDGKASVNTSLCTGCGLCAQVCPVGAIRISPVSVQPGTET